MSHFLTLVLVPEGEEIEEAVARLLAPFDEEGEWGRDGSRWDWYMEGGRWEGFLDPEYDPATDPRNFSRCKWCEGTGTRRIPTGQEGWEPREGYCNGCAREGPDGQYRGTGRSRNFQNAPHPEGNRKKAGEVLALLRDHPEMLPFAIVTPDGEWHEKARCGMFAVLLTPEKSYWSEKAEGLLAKFSEATAVVIDCHV